MSRTRYHALLLAALVVLASPLPAQGIPPGTNLPARFSVTGVAAGDVLDIHTEPGVAAATRGSLAHDATGIEVMGVSGDGAWALVPLREGVGWVRAEFLAPEPADPRAVPFPLRCLGTEPFWGVELRADGATWDTPEGGPRPLRPLGQAVSVDGFVLAYDDDGETRDVTVMRRDCTDGMSDRRYGFAALVWNRGDEVHEGCCFLE